MASESQPLLESFTGSGRVSMMENGTESETDLRLSLSEDQPLLQMRYEKKHEGQPVVPSVLVTVILFLSLLPARKKKLGMIFGVTLPCILSIFSVILFLRLGMVVGQVSL